jgi:hypothetical protein
VGFVPVFAACLVDAHYHISLAACNDGSPALTGKRAYFIGDDVLVDALKPFAFETSLKSSPLRAILR